MAAPTSAQCDLLCGDTSLLLFWFFVLADPTYWEQGYGLCLSKAELLGTSPLCEGWSSLNQVPIEDDRGIWCREMCDYDFYLKNAALQLRVRWKYFEGLRSIVPPRYRV